MNRRLLQAAVTAAAVLLALSACGAGPQYSDLDREPTADDQWPSTLPEYAADNLDRESSRLVGHDGSTALYLATSIEQPSDAVCLLVFAGDDNWTVACGTDGTLVSLGDATYGIRSDGMDVGQKAISENVYVE